MHESDGRTDGQTDTAGRHRPRIAASLGYSRATKIGIFNQYLALSLKRHNIMQKAIAEWRHFQ